MHSVGRSRERARLAELLGAGAPGRLALVIGEAGVGKSHLVREAVARARGVRVGRCFEGGGAAYGPWLEMFGADAGGALGARDERLRRFEAVLARVREAAPVVLVVEDLHWADPDSLALLRHV